MSVVSVFMHFAAADRLYTLGLVQSSHPLCLQPAGHAGESGRSLSMLVSGVGCVKVGGGAKAAVCADKMKRSAIACVVRIVRLGLRMRGSSAESSESC
jgi:hypothetical protein